MTVQFPLDVWARPGKEAFEFWISFFPTAPLFGVEWRFAEIMKTGLEANPASFAMPFPGAFPTNLAAAAAARPGELDSPALADDDAESPLVGATETEAAVEGAGRLAVETGISARAPETAVTPAAVAEEPTAGAATAAAVILEDAPAQFGADAVDAAIAAAPRPEVLLDARPDDPDDLKTIKGVGPGLERQLNDLGVWQIRQIARMTDADLAWIDANLTSFKGRCFRDDWIGQAKARLAM